MCQMQELVQVVNDGELATAWVAATADDGRRVVFIREADRPLLNDYCELGPGRCPVFQALTLKSA